jgi:Nif-specific regulatory protein
VNPRLLAVSGPIKDSTYAITTDEVAIGRDPSNSLSVSDVALSRRHCLLSKKDGGFWISDLDSRNGTFVNGEAVREKSLQHGDQISMGDSVFVFLLHDDEKILNESGDFDDSLTQATIQLNPEDARYPEQALAELPETSRLKQDLRALLKISQVVHATGTLDALQEKILDVLFESIPAEHGAVVLRGLSTGQVSITHTKSRTGIPRMVRVSRTITNQVLERGVAVLGTDVPNSRFSKAESLVLSKIRSLICVPLFAQQKVIGCIYLETSDPAQPFDEQHLELATAVARISAGALEKTRSLRWLEQENLRLMSEINLEHNIIGESLKMKEVYQLISRVAPVESTILIGGESGTGKELAARAIHRNSPRRNKAFVAINCAAIPEGLLESELFGHERGAFTGATTQKKGKIELADGGVLFLDEIGELALALQVKLLRVLQEHEFERVGGTRPISVNMRLIAATNKKLEAAVKNGEFRADLYYRLNVISLTMPPLRERREDIPSLARYFISKYAKRSGSNMAQIAPEALELLIHHDWPGNVRELENVMQRALVLCFDDVIRPEDFPESFLERETASTATSAKYHVAVKDLKKQLILNALKEANGNYTEGARILGVHANYLHRLIRNLDLKDAARATVTPLQ